MEPRSAFQGRQAQGSPSLGIPILMDGSKMNISGQAASLPVTSVVQLPRPAGDGPWLTLSPLSLGFPRKLREWGLCPPVAPSRVARDLQGRPLRQANGQAVVMADETDPHYQLERERYHQRVAVLTIVEGLRNDPQVRFSAQATDFPGDGAGYADRLFEELEAANWTAGDLVWLCTRICRLSNLLDEHLQETGADFSQADGVARGSAAA